MPHWLQLTAAVAGVLASWRWVIRPARRTFGEVIRLLRRINTSSDGVRTLAEENRALAGAVVNLSVAIGDDLAAQRAAINDLRTQLESTTRMVVDLDADVRRLQRAKGRE